MSDRDLFECIIAVDFNGMGYVVDFPERHREGIDGGFTDDNCFKNVPKEMGIYKCQVEFTFYLGYSDGYPAPGESEWEYKIISAEILSNGAKPNENISLEHVNALYEFLQGKSIDGVHIKPASKLSPRRAFDVIYFLQEYLRIIPDKFERCCKCGELYDSDSEGVYYRYSHYCDVCRPD